MLAGKKNCRNTVVKRLLLLLACPIYWEREVAIAAIDRPETKVQHFHTTAAFVRSMFADPQQMHRAPVAGPRTYQLDPRPDGDTARLFSRRENNLLGNLSECIDVASKTATNGTTHSKTNGRSNPDGGKAIGTGAGLVAKPRKARKEVGLRG